MKIVALALAAGALLAGVGSSGAFDFSVKGQVQPTYTDLVNGPDDFYVRGNLQATATGTIAGRFNYEFDGILTSERYSDLSQQDVDYAIGAASLSTTVAGFSHSLSATAITVLAPFYTEYEAEIVDLGWSVNRSVALGHGVSLTPSLALTRRLANTPEPERVQLSPSIELDFPLWEGTAAISATYNYGNYDIGGRIDNGYGIDVSWSRRLTKRLVVGWAADFSSTHSNLPGASYQVFEIGPRLTVNLWK